MNKIDTSKWGDFLVGDLFDIHPTKSYNMINSELLDDGDSPVVVNSAYNNGIGGYSTQDTTETGNIITFSDTVDANTIYYQEEDFIGYPHVQGMYPIGSYQDKWTRESLLFFVSVFRKTALTKGFDYGNKFRRDIAITLNVKLPIDTKGAPDWDYMESYIKDIESNVNESLAKLESVKTVNRKTVINNKWKEFVVGELFKDKICKPVVYHTKNVNENENGIPYVVRSKFSNGIKYRVDKPDIVNPPKVISWGAENATFSYQAEEWCSGRDIYYIDVNDLSRYSCMFLISCLSAITDKYSYNHGLFPKLLSQEKIKLPVDKNDNPDWQYMDGYMKNVEKQIKSNIDIITNSI